MNVRLPFTCFLGALGFLALSGLPSYCDEVCDEFPDVHAHWAFRAPLCQPTYSFTDKDGYLRITVPDGATAGTHFDNWVGVDLAPSFERYDMGSGDWTITTRLEMETEPMMYHHIGLMFAFGPSELNDIVYWGRYDNGDVTIIQPALVLERVGVGYRPGYTIDPGPVSLQVEKIGNEYHCRHRSDDSLDWIEDTIQTLTSTYPVTKVGLMVKTYGGAASPLVIADFDYFCLSVPDVTLPTDVVADPIPVLAPVTNLTCEKQLDGSVKLTMLPASCSTTNISVKVNGEVVQTLPLDAMDAVLTPPFPGGSILNIEVENGFHRPLTCTLADMIVDICDEFDVDPTQTGDWVFRSRLVGPTINVDDNPGFLRFFCPAGVSYDNWTGVDNAPSLERYDMGEYDWEISTRVQFASVPGLSHHVGLMVAWGRGLAEDGSNDMLYWGEYYDSLTLKVERTGAEVVPAMAYPGTSQGEAVSFKIQKVSNSLIFSHRMLDTDPWTNDASRVITFPWGSASSQTPIPVTRVGLVIKTWGAGEVIADFDYFCLRIVDSPPVVKIAATPASGTAPASIHFSAAGSVDPSGGSLTYKWDFGDGSTGEGLEVDHTYTKGGLITATVTATDNDRNTGTASTTVLISDDPSPFTLNRIGTSGSDGLVTVDKTGGVPEYCVMAGGLNIALGIDSCMFLEQKLAGDFKVTAKILEADLTEANARAGIMARLGTGDKSANAFMSIDGRVPPPDQNDGWQFQYRLKDGNSTIIPTAQPAIIPPRGPLPAWVQLERQGSTFIGYRSEDGIAFTEHYRFDIPNMNVAELYVGFAATSGNATKLADYCVELSGFGPTPQPPAKPAGLVATPGDGKVTLDWADNTEADLQGYNLYRSDTGPLGTYTQVNGSLIVPSAYEDTGRTNGTEYCYKVRAVNPAGESPDSDAACATPQAGGGFKRGDVNTDGAVDLSDPVSVLGFLFLGNPATLACKDAADADDTGELDITDAVYSLNWQFQGGKDIPAPGPFACGPDPTSDQFTECTYPQDKCQ